MAHPGTEKSDFESPFLSAFWCRLCKKLKEAMLSQFKENVLHRDGAALEDGISQGGLSFCAAFIMSLVRMTVRSVTSLDDAN